MPGIRWSVFLTVPMLLPPVWRAAWHFRRHASSDAGLSNTEFQNASDKRFRHYYTGTAFLGILFETMHGRKRSKSELGLFSKMAALAAHFDDLSDQPGEQANHLLDVRDYTHPADPGNKARRLLDVVNDHLPEANAVLFHESLNRVYRIETESRQTGAERLSPEVLADLTSEKGACSVLMFRCLLDWPLREAEKTALWSFGSLLQRCDDVFDVWFDLRSGTQTLATFWLQKNDPESLRDDFNKHIESTRKTFENLPVSPFRRAMAWDTAATIAAIGRVCTLRYVELKKKHGTLPLENRKLMVTDMGQMANQYKAVINWFL